MALVMNEVYCTLARDSRLDYGGLAGRSSILLRVRAKPKTQAQCLYCPHRYRISCHWNSRVVSVVTFGSVHFVPPNFLLSPTSWDEHWRDATTLLASHVNSAERASPRLLSFVNAYRHSRLSRDQYECSIWFTKGM